MSGQKRSLQAQLPIRKTGIEKLRGERKTLIAVNEFIVRLPSKSLWPDTQQTPFCRARTPLGVFPKQMGTIPSSPTSLSKNEVLPLWTRLSEQINLCQQMLFESISHTMGSSIENSEGIFGCFEGFRPCGPRHRNAGDGGHAAQLKTEIKQILQERLPCKHTIAWTSSIKTS